MITNKMVSGGVVGGQETGGEEANVPSPNTHLFVTNSHNLGGQQNKWEGEYIHESAYTKIFQNVDDRLFP